MTSDGGGQPKRPAGKRRGWMLEAVIGRAISRFEALRIARQILERAEKERLEIAEFEAAQGLQRGSGL